MLNGLCLLQRKLEELWREEEERARAEELRIAKLNALKEQTPYAQIIAGIVVRLAYRISLVRVAGELTSIASFSSRSPTRSARDKRQLRFESTSRPPKKTCQSTYVRFAGPSLVDTIIY